MQKHHSRDGVGGVVGGTTRKPSFASKKSITAAKEIPETCNKCGKLMLDKGATSLTNA